MSVRYLTKSRFKLAMECPTKLYYTGKPEFNNQKNDDSFLAALAEGGMQIGELAKCYFPNGKDIKTLNTQKALVETAKWLQQDNIVIYEAAIAYQNLLIRVDILQKKGNDIKLFEVKAKSFDPVDGSFLGAKGGIKTEWKPYLEDIAFQKYVVQRAMPQANVTAFLMLADKTVAAATDGLNQKLRITREGNRIVVTPVNIIQADLLPALLCQIPVDEECDLIYQTTYTDNNLSFSELVNHYASHYRDDRELTQSIGKHCKTCEFDGDIFAKSGRKRCWQRQLGWDESDFSDDTVLEIWNFRQADNLIKTGKIKLSHLTRSDIEPEDASDSLTTRQRQWLQIEKYQNQDNSVWINKNKLNAEIDSWTYPLHFIDFETSMVAIPFNKGRKPYEAIAFQFSHHKVYEDGRIEHAGQFLHTEPNVFPNYAFVRQLKNQLERDNGTVFCYSHHENSFLNHIYQQLQADESVIDRDELMAFIRTITHASDKVAKADRWTGNRNMVDMLELVKRYYYDPYTHGSNSIKAVLPGILKQSKALQAKYSQPIYGSHESLSSLNFTDWTWLVEQGGEWQNPYKQLPKLFDDIDEADKAYLTHLTEIEDGGAALTAYARLQFADVSDYERSKIEQGLLKYCELDTLAMVMLYEGWLDLLKN